jgi:subtilisin family serine protease
MISLLLLGVCGPIAAQPVSSTPDHQIMVMLRLAPPRFRAGTDYAGNYGDDAARGARKRTASRLARSHHLTLITSWPMPMLGVDCFIMAVPEGRIPLDAANEIAREPEVSWSEPIALYTAQASAPTHNDALFAAQPAAAQWHLAEVHSHVVGRGVSVAVIDSGIDQKHPDLVGQIAQSRNFVASMPVAETHGTAVAGIIAARADDKIGIAGVAPGARILALRACWQQDSRTLCDTLSLAKAVQFAVEHNSPIINMSLSGPPGRLLASLLRLGLDRGVTVVAAYDPALPEGGFPASLPGVVAVSDVEDRSSMRTVYVAPGRDIPAPQPGGRWSLVDGSSFSAAHMSGLFALLRGTGGRGLTIRSSRADGGSIDICATFVIDRCGVTRLAR